jgi:hypothetical protein
MILFTKPESSPLVLEGLRFGYLFNDSEVNVVCGIMAAWSLLKQQDIYS